MKGAVVELTLSQVGKTEKDQFNLISSGPVYWLFMQDRLALHWDGLLLASLLG